MKITIAGDLGSGKSTIAKIISEKLDFSYVSTGYLHRKIAEEYKVDSLKLNKIAKEDDSIDNRIDNYLKSLNNESDNFIIDSRLAWHFVKDSIRFYFEVDPEIGAERVLNDKGRFNEPEYNNKITALKKLTERKDIENERFAEKYKIDCNNLSNYDIIINTSNVSVSEISNMVIDIIKMAEQKITIPKYWINPKLLYPTENVRLVVRPETIEIKNSISQNNFNKSYPIECVKFNNFYFIWDGHKRCSGALNNNLNFVPIHVLAKNNEEIHKDLSVNDFAINSINQSSYYDWEDAHRFKYVNYPKI